MQQYNMLEQLKKIRAAIASPHIKYVSFDVFDTLLVRPVLNPTDLFYIVQKRLQEFKEFSDFNFMYIRPFIEQKTRKYVKEQFPHYEDITIEEIYDCFSSTFGIMEEQCDLIKKIEMEVERQYLKKRKILFELYEYVIKQNKKVIITSDMYLPTWFIKELLEINGYNSIDKYFVSAERRRSKGSGKLYIDILHELNITPQQLIHIGDNKASDFTKPTSLGITAFHIPKPIDLARDYRTDWTIWRHREDKLEIPFRLILGQIVNQIFDTLPPTGWDNRSLFNGNPYFLGYYGVGPFLLFMSLWLMREVTTHGYDVLGFIARDGYLPMQIYDLLLPFFPRAPKSLYCRISRGLCYAMEVNDLPSLLTSDKLLHLNRAKTNREVLESRLGGLLSQDEEKLLAEHGVALDEKFQNFGELCINTAKALPQPFARLEKARVTAVSYYEKLFEPYKKIALFDCGYSGRVQRVLSKYLKKKIDGYYIASFEDIYRLDIVNLWYNNWMTSSFNRAVDQFPLVTALLELFISEYQVGTIKSISPSGKLDFDPVEYNITNSRTLGSTQAGCMSFVQNIISIFGNDIRYISATPHVASKVLRTFCSNPSKADAQIFNGFLFGNGVIGDDFYIICNDEKKSFWKEGYRAIYSNATRPVPKQDSRANSSIIIYRNINELRKCVSQEFIEAISQMVQEYVPDGIKKECIAISRNSSKWYAARTLVKKSGGIWPSRFKLSDKLILQFYPLYFFCKRILKLHKK